ncbi:ORF V: Enzymatic polyprotein [Labeo rohita]|uniref:ORF V: Enzymatic polyprotein n=1 Tax=Labeo rohita TaxID=84645 RepID=A0ABQ8MV88_LABRO|nr:ORF V: Enzymatic polyprotein [Labeo rohita]
MSTCWSRIATCGCTCQKCGKFEVCFLHPISQVGPSGNTVIEFAAKSFTVGADRAAGQGSGPLPPTTPVCSLPRTVPYSTAFSAFRTSPFQVARHPLRSTAFSYKIDSGQECYGPLSGDRSPPGKGAIDPIPSAKMKEGGLRLVDGIRPEQHVLSCLDPPRLCLRDQAHQYKVPPAAYPYRPAPLRSSLVGYGLRTQGHGSQPLTQLGLRVNWEKSKLSPAQRISFLCVELDSVSMSASLSPERAQSVLRCVATLRCGQRSPKTGSEAPRAHGILSRSHADGFDAHETAAALASYSSPQVGVASGHIPCEHHTIVSPDTQPLDRHCVSTVRCSLGTSVQTHRCHHRCFQDRLGCHLQRAGSFRGLDRPLTILAHELSGVVGSASSSEEVPAYDSWGKHVLVRSDNTATVAYINHQGGVLSFCMSQLARHLLLWSQHRPKSLRATHILGKSNHIADSLHTQIHPLPVVVRSDRGPPRVRRTGTQLTEGLAQVCVSSSEPHRTNFVQSQGGQGTDSLGGPLLAQQNLVLRPVAPGISPSLAHSSEGGPLFSGEGHILAPVPQSLEPPPMVPGCDQEDFRDLSPSVVNTLLQARAPSS